MRLLLSIIRTLGTTVLVASLSAAPAQRSAPGQTVLGPRTFPPEGGQQGVLPGAVFDRRKISSADGLPLDPLDGMDHLGQSCARLGDVDGDGVVDIAAGTWDLDGEPPGAVFVLFLRANGGLKGFRKIDGRSGVLAGQVGSDLREAALAGPGDLDHDGVPDLVVARNSNLYVLFLASDGSVRSFVKSGGTPGTTLTDIGDLDGDGVGDVAIGAPNGGVSSRGTMEILFLRADGTIRARQRIGDGQGGFGGTLVLGDHFGSSFASLGDLDGDGVGDLAVGADGNSGAVWILFLNANGTVKAQTKSTVVPRLGASLAAVGDLNGDSVVDLAAGNPADNDGGTSQGAVWTLFLNSAGSVIGTQKVSALVGGFSGNLDPADGLGSSLAALGDLNGDGFGDLVAGAPGDDDNQDDTGALWILNMIQDGFVLGDPKISDRPGSLESTTDLGDEVGRSAAVVGDLDHDGIPELAIGASHDDDGGLDRGAVWILFPDEDGRTRRAQKISHTRGGLGNVLGDGFLFGEAVAGLGDLDGDGVPDLAVGAAGDGRGVVWILFLQADGSVRAKQKFGFNAGGLVGGPTPGATFGSALVCLGDLDGDGTRELVVGAPRNDRAANNDGALWVVSLDSAGLVQRQVEIRTGVGGFLEDPGSLRLGTSLASLGDLDGDGVADLAVGGVREDESGLGSLYSSGSVWILLLLADGSVKTHVKIDEGEGGFTGDLVARDVFGRSVAALGDLDGDGVTELAVGAPRDSVGVSTVTGAVWILFLDATGHVRSHLRISDTEGMGGLLDGFDNFGSALAPVGDHNGDGVPDLLVGARGDGHGAYWLLGLGGLARVGFEHADDQAGTPLVNGRSLVALPGYARALTIESAGANLGAALFDSTPLGPNDPSQDRDLLVGKGNLLILQDSAVSTQTVPGIFDRPNDDSDGGILTFRFPAPSAPLSLDLVDIDPGQTEASSVRLFDSQGRTRTYAIPAGWTEDRVTNGPPGWRRLDLTTLAPQPGFLATATATEVPGFDAGAVRRIEVTLGSSGAVDELRWNPHPGP